MTHLPIDPHDVVSVADLRAAGIDARHTAALVRGGGLVPLTRGWYAARSPADPVDRHRLVTEAHRRAYAGSAIPSHYSELVRLGLPLYRADLATVHLTRLRSGQARARPGLTVHRSITAALTAGGWLSERVAPALAIVQTGMVCGPMDALIAADAALHAGLITHVELGAALTLVTGLPGTHQLAEFLAGADARAESPGETRLRHTFRLMRLAVISQAEITDGGRTAFADFMLLDYPVIAEFDGLVKYEDRHGRSGRAALVAEKAREDWLRGLGFEVERVVWSELDHPALLARRMGQAINRTKGRPAPAAWVAAVRRAARRDQTLRRRPA